MDKPHFKWQDTATGCALFACDQLIGSILRFDHDQIRVTDEVSDEGDGLFRWTRTFAAQAPIRDARLRMEFLAPRPMRYGMIPAVSYDGNSWGLGQEPKGFITEGGARVFAYHRVAVSGGTYSESTDWSVALFAQEGFDGSCALVPTDYQTLHQLLLPESETPQVYIGRDRYDPPYEGSLNLESGDSLIVTAYLLIKTVEKPRQAWRHMLDAAWEQYHYVHQPRHSCEELWNWAVRYAKEYLWAEKGIFRGFSLGLQWLDEQWTQHPSAKYEIGWCGQNAFIANGLIYDYVRTGSQSSLAKGLAALDCWAEHAPLPNGLFRCHLDPMLDTESTADEIQDGCNLGAAAMYYFEAHELAAKCDVERPIYQTIALNICDFFVMHQFADGNLGRAWRNEGTCVATDGTTGGFMIPPLLMAFRRTGSEVYLETAKRAFACYVRGLLESGYTAAGALDTYCIDKESAIPLLRAGLMLYDLTEEAEYVELAEYAAYYLASWQWHHTIRYPPGTALHALNYDTFGGTSVSTQHHHQDPYGLTFVPDWMRLAELTGNNIWHQRALAVWANGMIGVSDGQLEVMGRQRPVGSQDEGFYHTRWYHPFDVSQWFVAWPTAFRLEVLRRLDDWSVLA